MLCVLAENCDEPMYKKLVQALCSEHHIPLVKVDSNKKLGEFVLSCRTWFITRSYCTLND